MAYRKIRAVARRLIKNASPPANPDYELSERTVEGKDYVDLKEALERLERLEKGVTSGEPGNSSH